MPNFKVPFTVQCTVFIEVEAEDKEDAVNEAYEQVYVSAYSGNGGINKLIGVSDSNHSIYSSDQYDLVEDEIEEIL